MRHRRWLVASFAAAAAAEHGSCAATNASFQCPSPALSPAPRTISMNCFGACPDPASPCIFHAGGAACSGLEQQPEQFGAATCVIGAGGECALECLAPFSGTERDAWHLLLTGTGVGFAEDVAAQRANDPAFGFVTRPIEWVHKITDLTFAPTTTHVSISGEALPVRDKVNNFTVVEKGSVVFVEMKTLDIFRNARNLSSIMIENIDLNGLATFPSGLPKLETLIISNNRLEAIPNGISSLMNLTTLDLSMNIFKKIDADQLPKTLTELNLQICSLVELPSAILQMPRLKKLDLAGNMFPSPPAKSLPLQLESLSLAWLTLRDLPPDVKDMQSLTVLELGLNELRDADLSNLPRSLEFLYLYGSRLQKLPDDLASLVNLTHFDLGENELTEIKAQALPPKLNFLNISSNQLSVLPANTLPPTLELLDLSMNKLKELPDDIAQLQTLKTLYLHTNLFTTFPEQVFALAALKVLTVDSPKLSGVAFTEAQAAFLAKLDSFVINTDALATTCATSVQVHDYSVCVGAASHTSVVRENGTRTAATVYILSAVGALIVVAAAVGFVCWKRKRADAYKLAQWQQHASVGRGSNSAKRMFVVEDRDSDSILESPSRRDGTCIGSVGDYMTSSRKLSMRTSSAKFSSQASSSSSKGSRRFISVWDDEELLRWRVDAAQIQDVELLGNGFYGEVWLARYLGSLVAVKRMKKRPTEQVDRSEIQQFIAEIRLMAQFSHPKIVSFIGAAWTMESDIQALVEYMPRGDLCSYIASVRKQSGSNNISAKKSHWGAITLQIAMDISEALVYLHSLSPLVLHRDLKSRNVLLGEELCAKLTDFGGSRVQGEDTSTQTTGVGTARWTAPEMLVGNHRYSEAVDIYSLGVILSELDTFQIPYAELENIPEACLLSRIASGEIQPAFTSNAPVDVVSLARQCLALDPAMRPSAVQVAYQLRQVAASANSHFCPADSYMSLTSSSATDSVVRSSSVGVL